MKKSEIRKKILKIRRQNVSKNLNLDLKSITKILRDNKITGKTIGAYYPYNYEVDILGVLKNLEKLKYLITLPRIKKNFQMEFFYWSTKEPLLINHYGIPEPMSKRVEYPDILLVPLVAFDKIFNRIGYGGGFYDRYIKKIKKNKKVVTIGIAYSFQKVKEIKTNKLDIKLDFVVTEKKFK